MRRPAAHPPAAAVKESGVAAPRHRVAARWRGGRATLPEQSQATAPTCEDFAGGTLHDQAQVCVRQDDLLGLDDVDVPLPQLRLDLQAVAARRVISILRSGHSAALQQ